MKRWLIVGIGCALALSVGLVAWRFTRPAAEAPPTVVIPVKPPPEPEAAVPTTPKASPLEPLAKLFEDLERLATPGARRSVLRSGLDPSRSDEAASLRRMADRFGAPIECALEPFCIDYGSAPEPVAGEPPTSLDLVPYLPLLESELSKYPEELARRTRIERIVLCTQLRVGDERRAAVPHHHRHALFLDPTRGASSPKYQRETLHHDLFHLIDAIDDASGLTDPEWVGLNETGFVYGSGGTSFIRDPASVWSGPLPRGFLSHYSRSGVEEDKAEIFKLLMADHRGVEKRANEDPILGAKVERMKKLLHDLDSRFDEAYWKDLLVTTQGL